MTAQPIENFRRPLPRQSVRMNLARPPARMVVGPWAHAVTNSQRSVTGQQQQFAATFEQISDAIAELASRQEWLSIFTADEVRDFINEYVEAVNHALESHTVDPIESVVNAWRNTAQIYADPGLRRTLAEPLDGSDYGSPEL